MSTFRELDERTTYGLVVRLLWNPETDEVVLRLTDNGLAYEPVIVAHEQARTAFLHPFVFVAELQLSIDDFEIATP